MHYGTGARATAVSSRVPRGRGLSAYPSDRLDFIGEKEDEEGGYTRLEV
jgi:hypothetical protein